MLEYFMKDRNDHQTSMFPLGCFALIAIIIVIIWFIGEPVDNDSSYTEFHICLQESKYEPVTEVPSDIKEIFVCGIIEGDGSGERGGVLYIYTKGQIIFSHSIGHYPGIFFEKINVENFTSGNYRIDVGSDKRVIASTEFQIINSLQNDQ